MAKTHFSVDLHRHRGRRRGDRHCGAFAHLETAAYSLEGAVIHSAKDTHKQEPVADATITVSHGLVSTTTRSDASGYFRITFPQVIWPGEILSITITHPNYHPLSFEWHIVFRSSLRRLMISELKPMATPPAPVSGKPPTVISDIRIRYTVAAPSEINIGSAVRTFQVVNQGNVPCNHQGPCSPNGAWKAATTPSPWMPAWATNIAMFAPRASPGPCPFTRIRTRAQGRTIVATAEDWSDTATFLLEAEVFHTSIDSSVRERTRFSLIAASASRFHPRKRVSRLKPT